MIYCGSDQRCHSKCWQHLIFFRVKNILWVTDSTCAKSWWIRSYISFIGSGMATIINYNLTEITIPWINIMKHAMHREVRVGYLLAWPRHFIKALPLSFTQRSPQGAEYVAAERQPPGSPIEVSFLCSRRNDSNITVWDTSRIPSLQRVTSVTKKHNLAHLSAELNV